MTKTLLLHCTQPFAQYRNPFTFYYAQTFPLPPKSTIVGMLQNATGKYYEEQFWNLKVSIHGGFESTFWNYSHMIKGDVFLKDGQLQNQSLPLYGGAKISQRTPINMQEMYNGHLWIFVQADDAFPYWPELVKALKEPQKVLCLGRSEDVIFIKDVKEVSHEIKSKRIEHNLRLKYPMLIRSVGFPLKNQQYPVYSMPTKVLFKNNGKIIKSKTEISKKTAREPQFETLIYTGLDFTAYLKEEINADVYNLNGDVFKIPEQGWI